MDLKELCTKSETTLSQLSRKTGISKVYISQLNTGAKKNPSMDILSKLAIGLKVKMEEVQKAIKS